MAQLQEQTKSQTRQSKHKANKMIQEIITFKTTLDSYKSQKQYYENLLATGNYAEEKSSSTVQVWVRQFGKSLSNNCEF